MVAVLAQIMDLATLLQTFRRSGDCRVVLHNRNLSAHPILSADAAISPLRRKRVVGQFVVFRSAKERPFAERKATTWQTDPLPGSVIRRKSSVKGFFRTC